MIQPYYSDDLVTLYHADCLEFTGWLEADVLVTDPPYGRGWKQGETQVSKGWASDKHPGITGDKDTATRDRALALWGCRCGIVFGDLMLAPATGTRHVCVFRKAPDAGTRGMTAGFRRDLEAIYLTGPWPGRMGQGVSSVIASGARLQASIAGVTGRYGHPHAKPVDVMETLIAACPPGVIADPFAGSGSTLVAARNLGRRCVGVEIDEAYCEKAARRLAQGALFTEVTAL